MLHFIFHSNRRLERALGKVEEVIESHLVLWTAAEQLAITQAFEKVRKRLVLLLFLLFFLTGEFIRKLLLFYSDAFNYFILQFGMNRRVLRNAVPEKTSDEAWDYTLR